MNSETGKKSGAQALTAKQKSADKQTRLSDALRANLRRRKEQARERKDAQDK